MQGRQLMKTILYDVKQTDANTDYLSIDPADQEIINNNILGILSAISELRLSANKSLIGIYQEWFDNSNKRFLYNSRIKRSNSPASLLGGCLNNMVFGGQRDFSLRQLEALQEVINTSILVLDTIEQKLGIKVQNKPMLTPIFIQENLWSRPL